MNPILEKFKEIIASVLPFVIIVVLIHFFVTPLEATTLIKFLLGALFITVGMPVFLQGIDLSISPMGEMMSQSLIKTRKISIILIGSFIFGFIVTVAEPDMHILAIQVNAVTAGQVGRVILLIAVSCGVGLMVALGILRMLQNMQLHLFLAVTYLIILVLAVFVNGDYLAIAFDANGSTTGAITVPFLLALSAGVAAITRTDKGETISSFGLLGVASTGAIVAVLILGILSGNPELTGTLPTEEVISGNPLSSIISAIPGTSLEALIVLLPVIVLMAVMNVITIKLDRRQLKKILVGLIYTWFGLTVFLTGVNVGFLEAARMLGYQLAELGMEWLLILFGIIFGIVTIPAEPSVYILTQQIENETAGSIKARTVLLTLCIGVGIAVGLSILRINIPALQLWHLLLPGMALSLILSFFVPRIFVGIAFDSGGVASGTMTATFILPFAQGAAEYIPTANVVTDGFGVISLVAMTPLITLQLLGFIYLLKLQKVQKSIRRKGTLDANE